MAQSNLFRQFSNFAFQLLITAAFTVCYLSRYHGVLLVQFDPEARNVDDDVNFFFAVLLYFTVVSLFHFFIVWIEGLDERFANITLREKTVSADSSGSDSDSEEERSIESTSTEESRSSYEERAKDLLTKWKLDRDYPDLSYQYDKWTTKNPHVICIRYSNDVSPVSVDRLITTVQNVVKRPYTVIDQSLFTTQHCGSTRIRTKSVSVSMFRRLISDLRKDTVVELFSTNVLRPAPTLIVCGDIIGEEVEKLDFDHVVNIFLSRSSEYRNLSEKRRAVTVLIEIIESNLETGCELVKEVLHPIYYKKNETVYADDSDEDNDLEQALDEKVTEMTDEDYRNDHQKQE